MCNNISNFRRSRLVELLYEGKAKRIYKTDTPNELHVQYKDDVTAGNGEKHDIMDGKGRLNNEISSLIFEYLHDFGIESHFIKKLSDTEQLVRSMKIIPLEVVVRNVAAGSITKRLPFESGQPLDKPLVEFFYKDDALGDPLITDAHVKALNIASDVEIAAIKTKALKINEALIELMDKMNLQLVDFKIEFGKDDQGIITLADEISPDTCRLWDKDTKENFDKDVYRKSTGNLLDAYEAFYNKLKGAVL